jgi:catechol 2,3-dioxygenase-like lactoylglutathione lyase family enzyme
MTELYAGRPERTIAMPARVTALDHLVLSVADQSATLAFYTDVLGMTAQTFHPVDGTTRHALKFGNQKINLHPAASPFEPKAAHAAPGTADLCFLTETTLKDWQAHLAALGVKIEQGPVARTGATGPILSIYLRDPDGNLIEISTPQG